MENIKGIDRILFHVCFILFACAYIAIFLDYTIVSYLNAGILLFSYFLIAKGYAEPVLFLILFSRCINGFMFPASNLSYNIFNALTGYIPVLLFVFTGKMNSMEIYKHFFVRYKFTLIYAGILLLFSLFDPMVSLPMLPVRILPLLFFILSLFVFKNKLNLGLVQTYFRYVFISSLAVYFFISHIEESSYLLENGIVFKEPVKQHHYYVLLDYLRNMGIFWDARILGIFATISIYISLKTNYAFRIFDLLLSFVTVATTFSRGPILICILLFIAGAFFMKESLNWKIFKIALMLIIAILSIQVLLNSPFVKFAETFFISKKDNALEQREGFHEYAWNEFIKNPAGHGVGYLKSPGQNRRVIVGSVSYDRVTDAYLTILLAEIGIIGFIFFMLSTFEFFNLNRLLDLFFLAGYLIQLIGTDVPDMGMFYFVFLILLNSCNKLNSV